MLDDSTARRAIVNGAAAVRPWRGLAKVRQAGVAGSSTRPIPSPFRDDRRHAGARDSAPINAQILAWLRRTPVINTPARGCIRMRS